MKLKHVTLMVKAVICNYVLCLTILIHQNISAHSLIWDVITFNHRSENSGISIKVSENKAETKYRNLQNPGLNRPCKCNLKTK